MAFGGSSGSGIAEFMQNQDIHNTNKNLFGAQVISSVKFHVHIHSAQGSQESSTPRSCMISSICLHCLCVVLWGIKVKPRTLMTNCGFEFYLFPLVWNVWWLVLDECDNVCERQLCQHLVEIDCGMAELSSFTCGLFFFFSTNCQHFTGSLTHCKISLKSFHIAGNTGLLGSWCHQVFWEIS